MSTLVRDAHQELSDSIQQLTIAYQRTLQEATLQYERGLAEVQRKYESQLKSALASEPDNAV